MSKLSRIRCHAVHDLPAAARETLARELFAVHAQIFAGLDYEEFREYVVERDAWRTWIYVKHNSAGQIVGYTSVHAFRLVIEGAKTLVVRMEAGTLPAYRGRDLTMIHAIMGLLRLWLRHPFSDFCILGALTHPSSYTFLSHYAPVIYPHATRAEIPPAILRRMEQLAARFQIDRVDPANPLVRKVDWITLESEEDRKRWRNSKRRDTRFYLEQNPGYVDGNGMLTYIPVTGRYLLLALVRFLAARGGKIVRVLLGREVARQPRRHPIDSAFQPLEPRR